MIEIQHVSKKIGSKTILDDVSLEIKKGEVVGLVGPNGAGKTTLFSLISTISSPTSGDIWIDGCSVRRQTKEVRALIGYVPQEIALYHSLSILDNLQFWATMSSVKINAKRIEQITKLLGLTDRLKEKIENLSGGYKRRVNLAVAMLHDPPILLMDEPTVGVDMYAKRELLPFIKKCKEQGTTIVYSSHDAEELLYLADRIVMLEQGKVIFDGRIEKAKEELDILQDLSQF